MTLEMKIRERLGKNSKLEDEKTPKVFFLPSSYQMYALVDYVLSTFQVNLWFTVHNLGVISI